MSRNSVTTAAGIKLGIFTLASIIVTGALASIMGNFSFGAGSDYRAVFTSASMLQKGDDVRVAGVAVGEIKKVEHHDRGQAMVTFHVEEGVPLTGTTRAEIRFLNLVGDRYLALEAGADKSAPALDEGDTIPVERTSPALDLTVLFNGFQPLFQALNPKQVNELSMNLVQVLQGEGGTVKSLLSKTASLTNTLADNDELIGEVITNLSETLETVHSHHKEFDSLIVELKGWMAHLSKDRLSIGSSIESLGDLTKVVADLLVEGRPLLKDDIVELRKLAQLLNKPENAKQVELLLDKVPESFSDQTRTGTYGSWYNYYLCGFKGKIRLPIISDLPGLKELQAQLNNLSFHSTAARCN